mgnify:CR=1 FL=1
MKHISEYLREYFEERSAILEYEAGYPREKAEALAKEEVESWAKQQEAKQ